MKNYFSIVVNRPWLSMPGVLAILFLITFGIQNIYFRGDYKIFFAPDNPQMQAFEELQSIFGKNDNITIVVAPKNGDIFTHENLSAITEITEQAWKIPYTVRVESLSNHLHTEVDGDNLTINDLVEEASVLQLGQGQIDKIKDIALNEPALRNRIISQDGRASMLNITVQMPEKFDQSAEVLKIISHVRKMVSEYEADHPNIQFHLGGMVTMTHAFVEHSQQDMGSLIPIMFLVFLVMLTLLFRSIFATIATLFVIILSIVTTLGASGWLGMYMSMATSNVPIIVMILAISDCVHVITSVFLAMRGGMEKREAILHSLKLNISPLLVTSLTTAIGFLSFNFSEVPPIRDLGNMVAIGVLLAFLCSVSILPILLSILPIRVKVRTDEKTAWIDRLGEWVIEKRKIILPSLAIVVLATSSLIALNKINDVPTEYFGKEVAFRQASDFMDEHLVGVNSLEFVLHAPEGVSISAPTFLSVVKDFTSWLRDQEVVDHVYTFSDTVKRLNRDMNTGSAEHYKLPIDSNLSAQYLLLYEMSLPYGADLNNQIAFDKKSLRLVVAIDNLGSKEIIEMENRSLSWFKQNAPEYKITIASPSVMFAHIGERNMKNMLIGSFAAMILISILLIFALRSFKLGMVSLLPNLAPVAMGFGFWALYSAQINLGLSVVTSMCLGIVVDDTVHFLSKYQYCRNLGKSAIDAVRFAFSNVGRAMSITTIVLICGFMVLAQSSFTSNGNMGMLTAIIIFIALVIDLLFLPTLLIAFDRKREEVEENTSETVSREYTIEQQIS